MYHCTMVNTRSGLKYGEGEVVPTRPSTHVTGHVDDKCQHLAVLTPRPHSPPGSITCRGEQNKSVASEGSCNSTTLGKTTSHSALDGQSSADWSNDIINDGDFLFFHDNLKLMVSVRRQLYLSSYKKENDFVFKLSFHGSVRKTVTFTKQHMLELVDKLDIIEAAVDQATLGLLPLLDKFKWHLGDGLILDVSNETGLGLRYWMISLHGKIYPMSGLNSGLNINLFEAKELLSLLRSLLIVYPDLCQEMACSLSHEDDVQSVISCAQCCYSLII